MILNKFKKMGYSFKMDKKGNITIHSDRGTPIPDKIFTLAQSNYNQIKDKLIEIKKKRVEALEVQLILGMTYNNFLQVNINGINKLIPICKPEDKQQLKNYGVTAITTNELTNIKLENLNRHRLNGLIQIENKLNGMFTNSNNAQT